MHVATARHRPKGPAVRKISPPDGNPGGSGGH